jgi:geranylgeranyl diphosphate synthase type II
MGADGSHRSMDTTTQLNGYRREVEAALQRFLPAADTPPSRLHAAMRYSLEAGGKRLRPVLALAAADLAGRCHDPLPAAVALECVHTYSLVHDDLPAMDDDDLRRGRPTCHRHYDEATAILAGDALLTHAFALLAIHYAATPALSRDLVAELADAAGSQRLVGGQMADIEAEGHATTLANVEFIHRGKTAAMIATSLVFGGLTGGAPAPVLASLRHFGEQLGLAFQAVDDVLDATASSTVLGKTAGKDARTGKATLVAVLGLEGARAYARERTAAAVAAAHRLPGDTHFLAALAAELETRTS